MSLCYQHNKASQTEIFRHLQCVSTTFVQDLSQRVNLEEYSQKLFSLAEREEAWFEDELIGLVAYYINNDTQHTFITNVSVDVNYQNQGIATELLNNTIEFSKRKSINLISLEVADDEKLLRFYTKQGFCYRNNDNANELTMYLAPLVVIRCTVFNHEPYLRDCLDGFVMQQTNFPFVAIVHDDASTDNSAAIIREYTEKYPDIIKPIYETENQYSKGDGSLGRIMSAAIDATSAKYVAMCEGDDYWTDPLKLQKQVDFLENHSEYDMVCARFNHLVHETGEIEEFDLYDKIISSNADGIEIRQEHFVSFAQPHTCTSMYRKGTLTDHPIIPTLKYKFDIPVYFCFLFLHRCWLMNEKVAVYRKHAGSLTLSGETENWSLVASHKELLAHFPNDPNLKQLVQYDERNALIKSPFNKEFTWLNFLKQLNVYKKTYHLEFKHILYIVKRVIKNRIKKYLKKS